MGGQNNRLCSVLITFVTSHGLPTLQALMAENKWSHPKACSPAYPSPPALHSICG